MSVPPGATSDASPVVIDGEARHSSHLVTAYVDVGDLKPFPGDLIEFQRDMYSHWALFVGNNQVVNVRGAQPTSDVSLTGTGTVRLEDLAFVAGSSKCRINNQEGEAMARGIQALHADEMVQKATALVGQDVPYSLFHRNCEHYVTEWRYGTPWSEQVETGQKKYGDLTQLAGQKDLPQLMAMLQAFMQERR
ncbi:putative HRAS-like suppressor 3 [Hypsibius exemplaris]|uniref:HRAS-like suppressor 3 n=1 Tax=Hypsibius exemplaris TaxID=2072580 RepID=A0A1W0XC71_HYPEX|nr:putative HRAS-like suppressor 3 [Hypsibius exemplaris]